MRGEPPPSAPLAVTDLIRLDRCLAVMGVLQEEMGEGKHGPFPRLRKYVEADRVRGKAWRGFYSRSAVVCRWRPRPGESGEIATWLGVLPERAHDTEAEGGRSCRAS